MATTPAPRRPRPSLSSLSRRPPGFTSTSQELPTPTIQRSTSPSSARASASASSLPISRPSNNMVYNELTPEEERIIVNKGTEPPYSSEYDNYFANGTYICRRCSTPLYE